MSRFVLFVSSHGEAPPACHALCFSCEFTWGGPACMSRPVIFVSSHGEAPPVCHALCFSLCFS